MWPKARKQWGDTLALVSKYLLLVFTVSEGFGDRYYENAEVAWNENSLELSQRAELLTQGFWSNSSFGKFAMRIESSDILLGSRVTQRQHLLSGGIWGPHCELTFSRLQHPPHPPPKGEVQWGCFTTVNRTQRQAVRRGPMPLVPVNHGSRDKETDS